MFCKILFFYDLVIVRATFKNGKYKSTYLNVLLWKRDYDLLLLILYVTFQQMAVTYVERLTKTLTLRVQ